MSTQHSRNEINDLLTQVETIAEVALKFDPQFKPNVSLIDAERMFLDVERIMTDLAIINDWLKVANSVVSSMINDLDQRLR